jgi:flavin reductase (DIM6/NTAB) family NADH-FMN oxidoreductase RutF
MSNHHGRAEAFERIAATVTTPMVIVTVRAGDQMDGCLVGFSTQCSIDPTRYLVCLSKANRTYAISRRATTLVVHVLHDDDHDFELARLFGEETAYETDKLTECQWREGPDGVPVLLGCDWFGARIVSRTDLGDHVGFLLDVHGGEATRTDEPYLGFTAVRDLDAGNPA